MGDEERRWADFTDIELVELLYALTSTVENGGASRFTHYLREECVEALRVRGHQPLVPEPETQQVAPDG